MAPKKLPTFTQVDFLYEGAWDEHVNKLFINCLSFQARLGNFHRGEHNVQAIMCGQDAIKCQYSLEFSYGYCMSKIVKLEERLSKFAWVLDTPYVVYDPITNKVSCLNSLRDYIMKVHNKMSLLLTHFYVASNNKFVFLVRRTHLPLYLLLDIMVILPGNS